jgi:hypothetical protein
MTITDAQRALLQDAAAGRLTVSGIRFYRDGTQLDVTAGWVAYDLLGAGLLAKADQKPAKYARISLTDSGRHALTAATAKEQQ